MPVLLLAEALQLLLLSALLCRVLLLRMMQPHWLLLSSLPRLRVFHLLLLALLLLLSPLLLLALLLLL